MIGIYRIRDNKDRIYVGSSTNVIKRLQHHRSRLACNKHHNPYLQNVYNKYGIGALDFSILEECSKENLIKREQSYLDFIFNNMDIHDILNANRVAVVNEVSETSNIRKSMSTCKPITLYNYKTLEKIIVQNRREFCRINDISSSLLRFLELRATKFAKNWILDGDVPPTKYTFKNIKSDIMEITYDISEFSRIHKLDSSCMYKIASGKRKIHKGWVLCS